MKRRSFLKGLFAAVGVAVLAPSLPAPVVAEALASPATTYTPIKCIESIHCPPDRIFIIDVSQWKRDGDRIFLDLKKGESLRAGMITNIGASK